MWDVHTLVFYYGMTDMMILWRDVDMIIKYWLNGDNECNHSINVSSSSRLKWFFVSKQLILFVTSSCSCWCCDGVFQFTMMFVRGMYLGGWLWYWSFLPMSWSQSLQSMRSRDCRLNLFAKLNGPCMIQLAVLMLIHSWYGISFFWSAILSDMSDGWMRWNLCDIIFWLDDTWYSSQNRWSGRLSLLSDGCWM